MSNYQKKNQLNRFKKKWTNETILWIINQIKLSTDYIDIQYRLAKEYSVTTRTAESWVDIAKMIMKDMENGHSFNEAIERDKDRRKMLRRKNKDLKYNLLTDDIVIEIKKLYKTGNYTQVQLANKYNAGQDTISRIVNGKSWTHI